MAPLENNHTPDPRPTGDLEHLFRQKLGEAEVPPRLHVWEQLDHELLVRQNDSYRRRLLLHRWVAAACALLVLGCGTWLLLHNATHLPPSATIATTTVGPNTSSSAASPAASDALSNESLGATRASSNSSGRTSSSNLTGSVASATSESVARREGSSENAAGTVAGRLLQAAKSAVGISSSSSQSLASSTSASSTEGAVAAAPSRQGQRGSEAGKSVGAFVPSLTEADPAQSVTGVFAPSGGTLAETPTVAAPFRRPETLSLSAPVPPTTTSLLAQTAKSAPQPAVEDIPKEPKTQGKWRVSGTYAATAFNPNIDFASSGPASAMDFGLAPSNAAVGSNAFNRSQSIYQYGASEYRENLEAGPAQRVVIAAAYALNSKWTLLTGVETAQQRASSKTSVSFGDARSAFAGRTATNSMVAQFYPGQRSTDFSYRTVGVPVAMRYGSTKTGLSLYAKVGAAVNVLLKSRTEVEGNSAATRDYTLSSSDSPYRKVLASVRGGGGVRYQPTDATWNLALGPVAEAGLNTLNQSPGGSFFKRSRPYSVGLEASVEFGGKKPLR